MQFSQKNIVILPPNSLQNLQNIEKNIMLHRFKIYFSVLLMAFLASLSAAAGPFTLVIDAGHGGHDSGAVGAVAKEKTINLNVALAFGKLVEQNCPDVKVIYTRKTDVFVTLQERANIANRAKADLFISIHTNAVASNKGGVYGAETYTLGMHRAADNLEVAKRENSVITMESNYKQQYQGFDPNKAESYIIFELMQDKYMVQSVKLAKAIQQQYGTAGRKNKGVHQAGFLVLRETSMPSVLTELGFISNPSEESFLNSSDGINKLARSIYNGFCSYHGQLANVIPTAEEPTQLLADNTPSVRPVATTPYPSAVQTPAEQTPPSSVNPAPKKKEKVEATTAPKAEAPKTETPKVETPQTEGLPTFRIQLLTSDRLLKEGDPRLKGLPAEYYKDGNTFKYTYGNSSDYNEIVNLKKTIADKFTGSFIIALQDGKRIDLTEARKLCSKK